MSKMVFMFRDSRERGGRDLFSCSDLDWQFLQELGTTFGWRPKGTMYQALAASKQVTVAVHDYQPGDGTDRKQVDRDDAISWGSALETAKQSAHFGAILQARLAALPEDDGTTLDSLHVLVDEFTAYVFGGGFSFAVADAAGPWAKT